MNLIFKPGTKPRSKTPEKRSSTVQYKRFKVACAGKISTGKTTFVWKFTSGQYEKDNNVLRIQCQENNGVLTKTIDYPYKRTNYRVQLEIYDTEEGERNNKLTQVYYGNTTILLLFFSLTSRDSFASLAETLNFCSNCGVHSQAVRVLVGTKADCERQREVNQADIDDFVNAHSLTYFATSSLKNTNVTEVFEFAVGQLLEKLSQDRFRGQTEILQYMEWTPPTTAEDAEKIETTEDGSATPTPTKRQSELSSSDVESESKKKTSADKKRRKK